MKFSTIFSLVSLATVGLAAPAPREEASALTSPMNDMTSVKNTVTDNASPQVEARQFGVGPATAVSAIRNTLIALEQTTFSSFNAINRAVANFQINPNGRDEVRTTVSANLKNILRDIQLATDTITYAGVISNAYGVNQAQVLQLNDAVLTVNRILTRLQQTLLTTQSVLSPQLNKDLKPDTDAVKTSIRNLVVPLSTYLNAVVRFSPSLNLTALYAASQDLIKILEVIVSTGVPNGNAITQATNGLRASLNLSLGK